MTCKSCGSVMRPEAQICPECKYNHLLGRHMVARPQSFIEKTVEPARPVIRRRSDVDTLNEAEVEDNLIRFPYTGKAGRSGAVDDQQVELPEWRQELRERVRQSRENRGLSPENPSNQGENAGHSGRDGGKGTDDSLLDRNPIVVSALKRLSKASSGVTPLPVANRASVATSRANTARVVEPEPPIGSPTAGRPIVKQTTTENVRSAPPPAPEKERRTTAPLSQPSTGLGREKIRPKIRETVAPPRLNGREATEQSVQTLAPPEKSREADQGQVSDSTPVKMVQRMAEPPASGTLLDKGQPAPPPVSIPAPAAVAMKPGEAVGEEQPRVTPQPDSRPIRTTGQLRLEDTPVTTQIIEVPQVFGPTALTKGQPATFWVRSLAGGCDFEIVSLSFLPIFACYAILNTILESGTLLLMVILLSGLAFLYYAVTLLLAGRTFGMAMLNLRLVSLKDDSNDVTRQQRLLRAWASTIAFLLPPLNLLIRAVTAQSLSLPDLVSKTVPVEN